ncbi:MAG: SigB/SigF/SigG family RNA polymerase sigma factor [Acidimicrobiia bacterium]
MNEEDAAEVLEQFRQYRRTGDRRLRNQLVEQHRWVAVRCAKKFARRGEPLDDLTQVAQLGVLKAVERFDPDYGVRFSSFALPTVMGELRRHFRDATWAVRVPRRSKDLYLELDGAAERLTHRLGRSPTVPELAESMHVTTEEILEAREIGLVYRTSRLGQSNDDESTSSDRHDIADEDVQLSTSEIRLTVRNLMERLPERERTILFLRYYKGLTQAEIAEEIGTSQVHVSRLIRASLRSMQRVIGDSALEVESSWGERASGEGDRVERIASMTAAPECCLRLPPVGHTGSALSV